MKGVIKQFLVIFCSHCDGQIDGVILVSRYLVDCKTVRIFAYSTTRQQSNKRSGTRLKTESETGELTPRFTDFFTDFEKKNPTVLQFSYLATISYYSKTPRLRTWIFPS